MTCRITIAHFEAVGSSVQPKRRSQNTLFSIIRLHYMTWHCGGHHRLAPRKRQSRHQDLLTQRCQQSGPLATCSIDRRCLRRFRSNMLGHQVGTAICFVCARRFPFVDGLTNQQISWLRAYEPRTGLFFDHVPEMLEALLGMSTYHARYVTTLPADMQPGLQSELAQWTCTIACAP